MESSGGQEGPKAPQQDQAPDPEGKPPTPEGAATAAAANGDEPGWWFRASTRVRAAGYWLRENLQAGARALGVGGERFGDFWQQRSIQSRVGICAGVALLLLLLLLRVVPVAGVPCQVSVEECPPAEESFQFAPADALLYAHLTLDEGSDQFERSRELFDELSDLRTILAAELPAALPTPSGTRIDITQDVLPWATRDLALNLLPGPGAVSLPAFVVGEEPAVRASVNAESGAAPRLEGAAEEQAVRDELPESRLAEVYLSRSGVQRLLAGRAGAATQLETFVDYGATDGVAAAAVAKDDGIELHLVSSLNPNLLKQNPSFFSELPTFEPTLTSEAGGRSIAYAGVGEVGPTVTELLERAAGGGAAGGLAGSLRGLSERLQKEAGVDPLSELLPALSGQAALVAEPTDGVPFASLIIDGVDEDQAAQGLAQLQRPLLRALGSGQGRVPRFEETEVDGVPVRSVQASASVNLSYAVFDDKLVISTDPEGIAQVRQGGGLDESQPFELATDDLPDEVSALVFLNLDELFGQVTRTDLVEDPFFANLSVIFENATSAALAVNADDEEIRSELFLALD